MASATTLGKGRAGFKPRHADKRRIQYRPKWDRQRVPAQASSEIQFFRNTSANRLKNNLDQAGVVSVYEAMVIKRLLFIPIYGTSEADMIELLNNSLVELHIQNDRAYELALITQQSGVGLVGGSVPSIGEAAVGKASSIGQVVIGGGISFFIMLKFPGGALKTQHDIILKCQLETMNDVTMG